jgi:hypothetical protein
MRKRYLLTYFLDNLIVLDDNKVVDTYEVAASNAEKPTFEVADLVDLCDPFSTSLGASIELGTDGEKNV